MYKTVCELKPKIMELRRTQRSITSKTATLVTCDKCDFKASNVDMRMHIKARHKLNLKKGSAKTLGKKANVLPHIKTLPEDLSLTEILDDTRSVTLEETAELRNVPSSIDCDWLPCDYKSNNKSHLIKHIDKHIGQKETMKEDMEVEDGFSCKQCDFDSQSKDELTKHIDVTHKINVPSSTDNIIEDNMITDEVVSVSEGDPEVKDSIVICGTCGEAFDEMHEFENHNIHDEPSVPILPEQYPCENCGDVFDSSLNLEWHIETEHVETEAVSDSPKFMCQLCDFVGGSTDYLEKHIVDNHVYPCEVCPSLYFQSLELLTNHLKTHQENIAHECNKCNSKFDQKSHLENHMCVISPEVNCDQCGFKAESVSELVNHLLRIHNNNSELIQCQHCEYKAIDMKKINEHFEADHLEFVFMGQIDANQNAVSQNFEKFKMELTKILNTIIEDHNVIKQELFIQRQDNHKHLEKIKKIEEGVTILTTMMSSSAPTPAGAASSGSSSGTPAVPFPAEKSQPIPELQPKENPEPLITKTCIIGDSISGNIDLKVLGKAMKSELTTAKAYSSIDDTNENEAKEKTRFPEKNFAKVINAEVKKSRPDILLIQSGSVDVTNLKTKGNNPDKYGEYFKQEVIISATNLFTHVCNVLKSDPHLKKVILMKQIPRYDHASNDPHAIKAALSQLYNDTLMQLWLASPLKDRLTIGSHRLECSGGVRESRYRFRNKFDGVHMFGQSDRKAYTESVLRIIRDAGHIKSPPPSYFRRYHKTEDEAKPTTQGRYNCPTQDTDWKNDQDVRHKIKGKTIFKSTVPTSNRFSSMNQENC